MENTTMQVVEKPLQDGLPESEQGTKNIKVARPIFPSLRPINDTCVGCERNVGLQDRQQIAWDAEGNVRRQCGKCIEKDKKRRADAE
jgi:hypothetical protein